MRTSALLIFFVASVSNAFPCAHFSGRYRDEENILLEIQQTNCTHIRFYSNETTTELRLDGKSRLHERGQNQVTYVKAQIDLKKLTLEQLIQDKFDQNKIIYQMILSYTFQDPETLIEVTQLFNSAGKLIDHKTMTLLKIKNPNERHINNQSLK